MRNGFKLGRKAVIYDSRTLRLKKYFTSALPPPPPTLDLTRGITAWGMLGNDIYGDCTCAGVGHQVQLWSANIGPEANITNPEVLAAYEEWCGWNPADPSTDQGGIELNILKDWQGNSFCGHYLAAFADPNVGNLTELKQAAYLFGGLYIGLQVPNSIANSDLDPAVVWDVVADDGGIDGGHCVVVCGYDADTIHFISWGQVYRMTNAFWAKYVDEAHCLLSPDWLDESGVDPVGFNLTQLMADLAQIN